MGVGGVMSGSDSLRLRVCCCGMTPACGHGPETEAVAAVEVEGEGDVRLDGITAVLPAKMSSSSSSFSDFHSAPSYMELPVGSLCAVANAQCAFSRSLRRIGCNRHRKWQMNGQERK